MDTLPKIIQGGMGAGVSNWRMARAVSRLGQLGVVSGTALDQIFARRLQDGDPGGDMRLGLDNFPDVGMAERVLNRYFIAVGKLAAEPYKKLPLHSKDNCTELVELCIVANFVEVFLARQGHNNAVGINYLEKVQIPHLPSIYGAMMGGVGYVLMGAGIPLKIPGVLDRLAQHEPVTYELSVAGALEGEDRTIRFSPAQYMDQTPGPLLRPKFIPIIASNVLALTMVRKANGRVDGFVVEGPVAGGHNAPPRGKAQWNDVGEPVYGERDQVDLEKLRDLGLPFWLAGGYGNPAKLEEALAAGAAGIQVGTAFAFCEESGVSLEYKMAVLGGIRSGAGVVLTDPLASPTDFPFKVVQLKGSLSENEIYLARPRVCDLGYLREAYRMAEGEIGYRCAAEPLTTYTAKGGTVANTIGRKCLCNALLANIGQPQLRGSAYVEKGLLTSGYDLVTLAQFLPAESCSFSAADVVDKLLAQKTNPIRASSSHPIG